MTSELRLSDKWIGFQDGYFHSADISAVIVRNEWIESYEFNPNYSPSSHNLQYVKAWVLVILNTEGKAIHFVPCLTKEEASDLQNDLMLEILSRKDQDDMINIKPIIDETSYPRLSWQWESIGVNKLQNNDQPN